jgi:two-component system, NarL family, sensor histidine kinase DesK
MVKWVGEQRSFREQERSAEVRQTVRAYLARGHAWWEKYLTNMEGAQEAVVASGVSPRLWRLYVAFWLVFPLLYPLIALVETHPAPLHLLLIRVAVMAIVVVVAGWLMWPHPLERIVYTRSRFYRTLLLLALLTALVLWLSLAYGVYWLWLLICVSGAAGVALPMRSAVLVLVALMLLSAGMSLGIEGGILRADWLQIIPLVLLVRGLGLDMIGLVRLSGTIRELHAAREELARLAVVEERLRLARDLHDLLGHTLSMITLKSELARHLVKEEPERCAQELAEIERVARKSLREVREAVAGYRHPQLSSELEGARQLLSAALIDAQIEPLPEALPPEISAVLAWTVREGVTNVIRHSRAQHCLIRLTQENGRVGAEVINDGGAHARAESASGLPGSGLAGLRERVTALGGRLEAGPLTLPGKERFRLYVELPL